MYSAFDKHLDEFDLYKIDTIGDAFVVLGGFNGRTRHGNRVSADVNAKQGLEDSPEAVASRVAHFALKMKEEMNAFTVRRIVAGSLGKD